MTQTFGRLAVSVVGAFIASMPVPASAQGVANGDFGSGDLSGWSLDTDGSPGGAPDFSVVGSSGAYAARIEADHFATPGVITSDPLNQVFLANTLYQSLDTTASLVQPLTLSFDWTYGGGDGDEAAGETFLVGLGDGSGALYGADGLPGHILAPTSTYGSGTVVAQLDPEAFNNVPGWTIEFQLVVGVDPSSYKPNALGSFVEIENVLLPEPGGPAPLLFCIGTLALLKGMRTRRVHGVRAESGLPGVGRS